MKFEVEVISEELVQPSSPTPPNLRRYKLSFLDQVTADVYNPMIYFYQLNTDSKFTGEIDIKNHLKDSLSAVLSHYYPLAGRLNHADFAIDCNDDGVPFLQTRVRSKLHDVISKSFPEDLNCLLPFELDRLDEISMGVQLNFFECGGIALGICVSHKIADALSFFSVVNGWAAAARGEAEAIVGRPDLVAANLFPARDTTLYDSRNSIVRERVARRFVMEGSKVEAIREKYAARMEEGQRRPSRVEALSALSFTAVSLPPLKTTKSLLKLIVNYCRLFLVCHTVNIRQKLNPPLPQNAFGNYYRSAMTLPSGETLTDDDCFSLVNEVRHQIAKIDAEFLKQFQEENNTAQLEIIKARNARFGKGEIVSCAFTSLCRFPLYDADFSWGSPTWAASPALPFKNLVVFMDAKSGHGAVDVVVHLKGSHMERLEADRKFLKFASPTGSSSDD